MKKISILFVLLLCGCGQSVLTTPYQRKCWEERTRFVCYETGTYELWETTSKGF